MALGRTAWTLTPDAFESLLSAFDVEDRERAGQKHEILRRKLLEFFAARGSRAPDEHADETLNRVARRLAEGEVVENIDKYCYGVAKFLWLEISRKKEPVALNDELAFPGTNDLEDEEQLRLEQERRIECFEECLSKLPEETRAFIIEYYREEKGLKIEHRKAQAARFKTTLNAMRLRASRLRRELAACIESCLSRRQ
jgi:DNA-directed RNA polymerase specialized sigma24 family protein